MQTSCWSATARWLFPVSSPPLECGVIVIDGERIAAVEPAGSRSPDLDFGDAAIIPGFVNAHTHLDLTGMRGLAPPSPDFTGWLRQVIAHRRKQTADEVRADIQAGIAECARAGTTLIGDISGDGSSWAELAAAPMRAVIFHELIGLSETRAREAAGNAFKWLGSHAALPTCRPALSPHAPYSFRAELLATLSSMPTALAIHLAESDAEIELLERQSGPFVPFLTDLGAWDPSGLPTDPDQVLRLTERAKTVLYIHGNYLSAKAPIPDHATLIYCPRTHAAFGHPPHPFREFLARGIRVALGTDSLASNPDLDLLAEARFVHQRYPDFSPAALLRMATLSGAEALGWADETGSLELGKSADLVVLPLPPRDAPDPHQLLFDSHSKVCRVWWRGAAVFP